MIDRPHSTKSSIWSLSGPAASRPWYPSVDLYQHPQGWLVKFELAGVQADEVAVKIEGSRLTIRGVRKDRTFAEGCRLYSMEIAYSRFERVVELPFDPVGLRIETAAKEGMLLILLKATE